VLVHSQSDAAKFHWLASGGVAGGLAWADIAAAALPGTDFLVENSTEYGREIGSFRHSIALLARRPRKMERDDYFIFDLARLATAMRGADWMYALIAAPIPDSIIAERIGHLQHYEKRVRQTWMRRGTAEETNQSAARDLLELISAELERHHEGSAIGMWEAQACLLCDDPAVLTAGALAWRGQAAHANLTLAAWLTAPCRLQSTCSPALSCLTSREVPAMVPLPLEECDGTPVRQRVLFAQAGATISTGPSIAIGRVIRDRRPSQTWLQVPVQDLTRHILIAGSTRSGKTQTAQFCAYQIWEEQRVPFLVLDPAKSDYRRLFRSGLGNELRMYTPGLVDGVAFSFNPLAVPEGVPANIHMDGIRDLLLAAFGWVEPMPAVLAIALEVVYRASGWNLQTGTHPKGWAPEVMPRLTDLIKAIPVVVEKLGWTGEAANTLRSGPITRLNSLLTGPRMTVLNPATSTDILSLLEHPTVIEMGWFGTDEDKAFLLGGLILALAEVRQVQGTSSHLKHLALIEEAHCLLAAPPSTGNSEYAEPRQKAVRQFCNLLASIGGYGQALAVVEQIPTKLAPDLLANTGLKIVHQLVLEQDAEAVGAAMNLTAEQRRFLTSLRPGDALAFRAGDNGAYHIKVPDHAGRLGFGGLHISNAEIARQMARHVADIAAA
jgi:hypothetical protein